MKRFLLVGLLCGVGCGGSNPVTPTVTIPACQTNNTADLLLTNASATSVTFDVLIDGVRRMQGLVPGQNAGPYTLVAGVAHTVNAVVTNSTIVACSSAPILAQCSTQTLVCRGP